MLRFFRQIRKTLMEQNKTRSYLFYAIGEIALVMIGILLALQINNWNELRKQGLEEKALLERLQSEFIQNQSSLEKEIANYEWIMDEMNFLLSHTGTNPEPIAEFRFDTAFTRVSWIPRYSPFRGTINSIINSGKIGIIENERLNSLLTNWPGYLDKLDYLYQILYDLSKNQHMEFLMNRYPFRNAGVKTNSGSSGRSDFIYDKQAILKDIRFENIVEFKKIDSDYTLQILKELYEKQTEVLELIEMELEKE